MVFFHFFEGKVDEHLNVMKEFLGENNPYFIAINNIARQLSQATNLVQKETKLKITTVELKIQAITMEQLTRYLHGVEHTNNNLHIKRLSIAETGKPEGYIDVVMQVETFET